MKNSEKPCAFQRTSKNELELYHAHRQQLKYATKKSDNNPPPLPFTSIYRSAQYVGDLRRLNQLETDNREMLKKINITYRTGGKTDSSCPKLAKTSNYRMRAARNIQIEKSNFVLYERMQSVRPTYDVAATERDYMVMRKIMIFNSRYPEHYDTPPNPLDLWTICPSEIDRPVACNPSKRAMCYFDVEVAGENWKLGRIVMEIYRDFVPVAGENFVGHCRGDGGLSYRGTPFHRIVKGWFCLGGDVQKGNGLGKVSTYGPPFPDEGHVLKFAGPGVISTYSPEKNTNNSQFMITFKELQTLNDRFVVFGRVFNSLRVLQIIEDFGTRMGKPRRKVIIGDCGVLGEVKTEYDECHLQTEISEE